MKLGEALTERAEAVRRVEQLRTRINGSARYQEGELPPEDATVLLTELDQVLDNLESLMRRINRTNAVVPVGDLGTLTDALARRDVLRLRHAAITAAADAAAGSGRGHLARQLRSELKMLAALPVAELRGRADGIAGQLRELDVHIQRTNWEVDLLD
ncbi:DIP1984 family protein [Micromonospora sp. NPDC048935]|uniref:DIP1984 family protein n=1 Tax=Micromonospora sp. NPDC048935 TaxID=3364262 RepID=UPI00371FA1E7